AHNLLSLCTLRRNGVGECRDCRQKSEADAQKNVRRPSQATNDDPRVGGGTGAPGGAGTSRRARLATFSDERQRTTVTNHGQNLAICVASNRSLLVCGVVRSRTVLGQAHTPRQRLSLLAVLALVVLVAPAVSGAIPSHSASALRAQDAALAAKSRAATLELYSLDQQLANAESHLAALQQKADDLRAERAILAHQISVAKRGTRIAQRRLARGLGAL